MPMNYCPGCGMKLGPATARPTDVFISEIKERRKPKRKLSAWTKFIKANAKKPRFRYRNGKLNLKKMAIAFRKTPAGKKKRR